LGPSGPSIEKRFSAWFTITWNVKFSSVMAEGLSFLLSDAHAADGWRPQSTGMPYQHMIRHISTETEYVKRSWPRACLKATLSAAFTTIAFDDSGLRWLETGT